MSISTCHVCITLLSVEAAEGDDLGCEDEGQDDKGEANPDEGARLALATLGLVLTHGDLQLASCPSDINSQTLKIFKKRKNVLFGKKLLILPREHLLPQNVLPLSSATFCLRSLVSE